MNQPANIFNRRLLSDHRHRAVKFINSHDFLFTHAAQCLAERLAAGTFPLALDIGSRKNYILQAFKEHDIGKWVQTDLVMPMLNQDEAILKAVADEELLPFKEQSFDLIVSGLNLHWVNDLPGTLVQIRRLLKPDGVFIASLFGSDTLKELRHVMSEVEIAQTGGISPRIAPFADVKTLGSLVQRAGLGMPVADSDRLMVEYNNAFTLLADIRGMGEANCMVQRGKPLTKAMIAGIDETYSALYGNDSGGITATFEIVTLTGLAADNKM